MFSSTALPVASPPVPHVDEQNRPPLTGDEITTLVGFLEYQRATLDLLYTRAVLVKQP